MSARRPSGRHSRQPVRGAGKVGRRGRGTQTTSFNARARGALDAFLDVYALSQHALRLPRLDRALPPGLPEGVALDAQKVDLGHDAKGTFVGLVSKRHGRGDKGP